MIARVNLEQVDRFAEWLPAWGGAKAFDFCAGGEGLLFPVAGSPGALDFFFANAGHQFGFWVARDGRYDRPMVAEVGGQSRKGSDYLFFCFHRGLARRADFWAPQQMAGLTDAEWDAVFHDDTGRNPLPMWEAHLRIFREYADWFAEREKVPADLVAEAAAAAKPLATFLRLTGEVPGYREDPLKKKMMLLAVMLENRPEKFLSVSDPASAVPIIDYHLQRSALRTGLVELIDADVQEHNRGRELVDEQTESEIRQATYDAIAQLVERSGLSVAAIDYFFFMNRTRCPEMTLPQCEVCPAATVCIRNTEAFQPVFRTEAY